MRKESKEYHRKHNEKRKNKTVSFRVDIEEEMQLLEYVETLPNFAEWVKDKLRAETGGKR